MADTPTTPTAPVAVDLPELLSAADPRFRAWRRFLVAHAVVTRQLEAELLAEQELSLADFDVLIQLAMADGRTLRMSELADRVLLSRSGMTRRIDRLETAGLVERRVCSDDRRGANAMLTTAGLTRLRVALPIHVRGVREHFLDRLDPDDVQALRHALRKVVDTEDGRRREPDLVAG